MAEICLKKRKYAIFSTKGIPFVLGETTEADAKDECRQAGQGAILVEITDKGGVPVDFLAGECPKGIYEKEMKYKELAMPIFLSIESQKNSDRK